MNNIVRISCFEANNMSVKNMKKQKLEYVIATVLSWWLLSDHRTHQNTGDCDPQTSLCLLILCVKCDWVPITSDLDNGEQELMQNFIDKSDACDRQSDNAGTQILHRYLWGGCVNIEEFIDEDNDILHVNLQKWTSESDVMLML